MEEEEYLTIEDVARELQISTRQAWIRVQREMLPQVNLPDQGRRIFFPRSQVGPLGLSTEVSAARPSEDAEAPPADVPGEDGEEYLSVAEIAEELGLSQRQVWTRINRAGIPRFSLPGRHKTRFFRRSDVPGIAGPRETIRSTWHPGTVAPGGTKRGKTNPSAVLEPVVGAFVRKIRADAKVSQRELARVTGINVSMFSRVEWAERHLSIPEWREICRALDLDFADANRALSEWLSMAEALGSEEVTRRITALEKPLRIRRRH
jgi:transcriptional regulator with XRE-family HTH domain